MEISRNRLAEAIRLGLVAGIFAGVGAGFASPVLAQDEGEDQQQASEEDSADLSRVTVTGSRIERAGLDTFYPAITVDRQLLEDRAYTNVADALNEIPTFGNPDVTPQGVQNGFSVGQNFVAKSRPSVTRTSRPRACRTVSRSARTSSTSWAWALSAP